MITLHYRKKQTWLNARKDYITGTDAATIVGLNPYKTNVELYYSKKVKGIKDNFDSVKMKRGRSMEKPLIDLFSIDHNDLTVTIPRPNTLYVNDDETSGAKNILAGSFDALLYDNVKQTNGFLEIKTTKTPHIFISDLKATIGAKKFFRCEDIPTIYQYQIAHYFLVNPEFSFCYLVMHMWEWQISAFVIKTFYIVKTFNPTRLMDAEMGDYLDIDLDKLLKAEAKFYRELKDNKLPKRKNPKEDESLEMTLQEEQND
jgi:putative phage-type endonuclease